MKRLFKFEQSNWPQIMPVFKLKLGKQDLKEGPWAMAMTPIQFCEHYHLLDAQQEPTQKTATLLKSAANKTFALQLGAPWTQVEALPLHVQALFAVFAAREQQDREPAEALLKRLSRSSVTEKLDFTGVSALLKKHKDTALVRKVTQRHAYVLTVMAAMLELGRMDGVIATVDFLWLKPLDRRLWYMLNSVGRQTAVPEISGAFAHWLAEKTLKRAIRVPMVDEAVKGLEAALSECIYYDED